MGYEMPGAAGKQTRRQRLLIGAAIVVIMVVVASAAAVIAVRSHQREAFAGARRRQPGAASCPGAVRS